MAEYASLFRPSRLKPPPWTGFFALRQRHFGLDRRASGAVIESDAGQQSEFCSTSLAGANDRPTAVCPGFG